MDDNVLSGYITEAKLARQRGVTTRTLARERQRRDGPPFCKIGRKTFYPIEGFRRWLRDIEQRPKRGRAA